MAIWSRHRCGDVVPVGLEVVVVVTWRGAGKGGRVEVVVVK